MHFHYRKTEIRQKHTFRRVSNRRQDVCLMTTNSSKTENLSAQHRLDVSISTQTYQTMTLKTHLGKKTNFLAIIFELYPHICQQTAKVFNVVN